MSTQHTHPRVAVGVDGSPDSLAALRYAAREATSLGAVLEVVHVVPDYLPVSPMMPLTPADLTETGRSILDDAVARVRDEAPALETRSRLCHGTRATRLLEAAEGAEVLVVGRDSRPLLDRWWRGDTVTGAAARAGVPVVQVPADWTRDGHRVVLVGVKSPSHVGGMLADAFALARRRNATLVVLHAWRLPSVYDDIIEMRVDLDEWEQEATSQLDILVRDWRAAYPDVRVETWVVHDHPAHALVEASRSADLVLIVRRQYGVPAAAHLGRTARSVLRSAHCPVRVVAPSDVVPIPSLVVEERGSLAR